ncbi:hypothetical protein PBAL39_06816 [Pedobacter sp. BAL39]|uniref:hypothetical protein n=1 Tax=Pedobacter sp. BAL39 TaxID=391596 RepID=UPI0001559E50|nr:hypothetical protein [Pedobacter sp. BAL39]EDM35871.1 hypothetical protein PBAL39_06816 [Pedobacter sp. BAL39]
MENKLENEEWMSGTPEGYFDSLSERIRQSVFLDDLRAKVADGGFITPDNYFEALPEVIHGNSFLEQLKGSSPVETAGFITPEGYFSGLSSRIVAQAHDDNDDLNEVTMAVQAPSKHAVKIVRLWHSSFLKYASAACFILLSAAGLYFYQQKPEPVVNYAELANEQMLYDIDEHVIIEHIQAASMEEEQPVVATADLENYILTNYSQNDIASDL